MSNLLLAALLCSSQLSAADTSVGSLLEDGWSLLPLYAGEQRPSLTPVEAPRVRAAQLVFAAALELDPQNLLGWWRLGHAHVLLATDAQSRGAVESAREQCAAALAALDRAHELDPGDPWAAYARGPLLTAFGQYERALSDLDAVIRMVKARRGTDDAGNYDPQMRFKTLEWRTEVLMRMGDFGEARKALESFHDEFSTNTWPLSIALAESHLRERDFDAARAVYEAVIADPEFASDSQVYALLGYVEGLVGRPAQAAERMSAALERELEPDLYTRLWAWILATEDGRTAAREELSAFVEYPPGNLSEWGRRLGAFVLGAGTPDEFLAAAHAEVQRRLDAVEPVDDLLCEAWFYKGLRHAEDAAAAADAAQSLAARRAALTAYDRALSFSPSQWKWEWAYARLHLARLAAELGAAGHAQFGSTEQGTLRLFDPEEREFAVEAAQWHAPGTSQPVANLGRAALPGDLLLVHARDPESGRVWLALPVRARLGD